MKHLLTTLFAILLLNCSSTFLSNVSTDELQHKDNSIYLNNIEIAYLSATELSWDNGRIVTEITFKLTSPEYNGYALPIIKLIHEHNPNVEIEVELQQHN